MSNAQLTYTVQMDMTGHGLSFVFSGTDVTSKAVAGLGFEPVTVTWGRQDQFSAVNPTTVSGAMLNSDGTFTPGNASSTYYPRIRRGLRRRVSVTTNLTRTNLITNPSFEVDTTQWAQDSGTIARSTAQAAVGTASLSIHATATASVIDALGGYPGYIPVTAGLPYAAQCRILPDPLATARLCAIEIIWYTSAKAQISISAAAQVIETPGTWLTRSVVGTAPVNAAFALVVPTIYNPAVGELHYVDAVLFEQSSTVGSYFDGSTAADTNYTYAWSGTANASTSIASPVVVNLSEDFATSIEVVPAKDTTAVTKIDGSDILARFGSSSPSTSDPNAPAIGTTLRSFLAEEMLLDGQFGLYMFQEGSGATSFADVTGTGAVCTIGNSTAGSGTVSAGQTATGTFYGGTMVTISNPTYSTWTSGAAAASWITLDTTHSIGGGSGFGIELWVETQTTAPASSARILSGLGDYPYVAVQSDGTVQFVYDASTSIVGPKICDGKVHQIVLTTPTGSSIGLMVDGVSIGTTAATLTALPNTFYLGCGVDPANLAFAPFSGGIAYVGLYQGGTLPSNTRFAAHYSAGATAFAGERTDQRIARLLSYRANPGYTVETGLGTMGVQSTVGRTLQECLIEVGQVEAGAVFVDGTGKVNFRSRSRLFNPSPTVTLDMSVGGVDFGSNWREDTQNVINDATVTNSTTGSNQRFFDSSSISSDGEFSTSYSLPLNSDSDALNLAGWIVVNGTQQQLVATPLIVNLLHLTAAQAQAVLQLKPLDCLQLTNCPTPAPSSSMTFIVQGGTINLAADAATVTLNLTRLPYPVGVWDSTNWDASGVTWAF